MRRVLFAAVLCVALVPGVRPLAAEGKKVGSDLAPSYYVDGDPRQSVAVKWVGKNLYFVGGRGWEGVGMMTPRGYWGVFQQRLDSDSSAEGTRGTHAGLVRPDGTIAIHGEYSDGKRGTFDVVWSPAPAPPAPPPPPATDPDRLPALGDYVYVEELPEALTKVKPVTNPTTPQGTVLVQALVGADGKVKDTRVVKSVPGLDDAAVAAVRQWVFKPAMTKGKPVAVWVAVPVRFER